MKTQFVCAWFCLRVIALVTGLCFASDRSVSAYACPLAGRVDTLALTVEEAEQRFLRNNLQLLAARFSIDAARAAVLQAQLWNNPNIAVEQNVYNQFTGRYFDVTRNGNTEVQIQQLFLLAGKRDKQVRLAQINAAIVEHQFYDLLRALRLEIRSDIFDLYFLQQSLAFYDESISTLVRTVAAVERIYEKRSILLADVLRLKSLLFSLQNERRGFVSQIIDIQGSLRTLLRDSVEVYYTSRIDKPDLDSLRVEDLRLEDLALGALDRRPDFKIAQATLEYEATNLSLQRALRTPDVTVGGRWARQGSYIPEYFALTVAVDLPILNRNQGNIQMSEMNLEADRRLRDNARLTVEKEVTAAFRKAVDVDRMYRNFDKKFTGEYKVLIDGVVVNYQNRNVSLLEFTDFYESFRTSMVQWNQLQSDRADAFENLNYAVGATALKAH